MRSLEAQIVLEYRNGHVARAVANAVLPDNFKTPKGLSIETNSNGTKVITTVKCKRGIPSLIATLDDLLFCASTAERILQTAEGLEI